MAVTKKKQKKLRRDLQKQEIQFDKRLLEIYKKAQYNILEEIRKLSDRQKLNIDDIYEYSRLDNLKKKFISEFRVLEEKTRGVINKELIFMYERSHHLTSYIASLEIGVNIPKRIINDKVIKLALKNTFDLVGWEGRLKTNLAKTVIQLQNELGVGLTLGESYSKISKRVQKVINVSNSEALRISWTESHRVQEKANNDSLEYLETLGLNMNNFWISTIDSRTRPSHQRADGQEKDKEGYYTIGDGVKTKAPGNSGVAREDIRCRCTQGVKYEGETPKFRRVRDKGIVPYKTYDEYLTR